VWLFFGTVQSITVDPDFLNTQFLQCLISQAIFFFLRKNTIWEKFTLNFADLVKNWKSIVLTSLKSKYAYKAQGNLHLYH